MIGGGHFGPKIDQAGLQFPAAAVFGRQRFGPIPLIPVEDRDRDPKGNIPSVKVRIADALLILVRIAESGGHFREGVAPLDQTVRSGLRDQQPKRPNIGAVALRLGEGLLDRKRFDLRQILQ